MSITSSRTAMPTTEAVLTTEAGPTDEALPTTEILPTFTADIEPTSNIEAESTPTEELEAIEEVKEKPEEFKGEEEEASSTELLLVPLMATKEDHPLTSLAQLADYIKVWTDECIKKLLSSAPSLHN